MAFDLLYKPTSQLPAISENFRKSTGQNPAPFMLRFSPDLWPHRRVSRWSPGHKYIRNYQLLRSKSIQLTAGKLYFTKLFSKGHFKDRKKKEIKCESVLAGSGREPEPKETSWWDLPPSCDSGCLNSAQPRLKLEKKEGSGGLI